MPRNIDLTEAEWTLMEQLWGAPGQTGRALTDALAQELSVRFKSRFTTDPASYEDVVRFVRGVLSDLRQSGALRPLRRKTSARIRRSRYADRLQARLDLRERSKIRP